MSDQLKDSLSTMIRNSAAATQAGKLSEALNWAGLAVAATRESKVQETRAQVISTVTVMVLKAATETRRAAMRGSGLFAGLDANIQVLVRGSELFADMARGADSESELAQALVIAGHAKQLDSAILPHRSSIYHVTDAPTFDAFLTTLAALIDATSKLTTEPTLDATTEAERIKLAATAVSNARHSLSSIFPKKLSDWDKARVLCRHALALVEGSRPALKTDFAGADKALESNDYKTSNALLTALEASLGGGD